MKYSINDDNIKHVVLDRVVYLSRKGEHFVLTELCDEVFEMHMTAEQLRSLGERLIEVSEGVNLEDILPYEPPIGIVGGMHDDIKLYLKNSQS